MTVYVDDMCDDPMGQFGRMKMSHLTADTTEELLDMVKKIGVQSRWIQSRGTYKEHFDIAKGKRQLAIQAGAIPITLRQSACMVARRRLTGSLGSPEDAVEWRQSLKGTNESQS
jgi:hypothetical protein